MLGLRPRGTRGAGFPLLRRTATLDLAFAWFTGLAWFAGLARFALVAAFAILALIPAPFLLLARLARPTRATPASSRAVRTRSGADMCHLGRDCRGATGLTCQPADDVPDLLNERKSQWLPTLFIYERSYNLPHFSLMCNCSGAILPHIPNLRTL